MPDFCHLHCHTSYSLLDGAARIKTLLERAAAMDMKALGITDHGNLFGIPEFYTTAKKIGVHPVLGSEFYVTASGMQDRQVRTRYHQVLWAKNEQGYRNLTQLSSLSYTEGFYYKPRIDHEALRRYGEGLVATTCCLQGEVPQTILKKGEEAARAVFEAYLDLFGDDYYIEIQNHGIADQQTVNAVLVRWAREYGVKIVATNDVHYVEQEDAAAQDVLLCLQTGKDLLDPSRMRFEGDQFYLKSAEEMQAAIAEVDPEIVQQALAATGEIADKCRFDLAMGNLLMPHYPIPEAFGDDIDAYLRHLVFERARSRYPEMPQTVVDRLNHELGIIKTMGYTGYFLIVQDFTTAARELGVSVGPGRGSAAGSAVAYCLGVTNIDPLKYGLLFERFLNPERVSMPDIDIDFDDRGRAKVIDYVIQKYGRENVCQIITFGTMGARSVIRDVARVLGIPLPEADRIAKMIPEGPKVSLASAMADVRAFRALKDDPNAQIRKLMHYAEVLEGSARHTGVHAAGVIIAPGRVSDYIPIAIAKNKGDPVVTTQYAGNWIEKFGLLKMDFLGLSTLTILNDAVALIKKNHGVEIDLDAIPLDDEKTLALFQRGETIAIFQFESEGMREWITKLKPTSLDDLIAMNALYRPGPMDLIPNYVRRKHGQEKIEYPHPMLEPVLKKTFGIPVYQEQVMQMAQVMGGFTLGKADVLRRGMGKKNREVVESMYPEFMQGAKERDVDEKTANEVWEMMAKFSGYGFCRGHAAAYSLIAYQTAYLKANYPAEFMAAVMTNEMGDTKKLPVVLEEARRMHLELLRPSINHSHAQFTVEDGHIRFGLGAIKGVGLGAIEVMVKARDEVGPFTSLFGMTKELDLRAMGKKALESLARVGALDDLEGHRAQLVAAVDTAVQYAQKAQADEAAGQNSLFGDSAVSGFSLEPNLPIEDPWPMARLLKEERELIGFYISGHPLDEYRPEAMSFATAQLGDTESFSQEPDEDLSQNGRNGQNGRKGHARNKPMHSFCGIITEVQHRTTKTGKPISFATLEDFTGQGELVCFSTILEKVQNYLKVDEIVLVRGEVEVRGGSIKILTRDIIPMWKVREHLVKSIVVRIDPGRVEPKTIEQFRALCEENQGRCRLFFDVLTPELSTGRQRIRSRTCVVDPTEALMQGVTRLFGRENVLLEGEA